MTAIIQNQLWRNKILLGGRIAALVAIFCLSFYPSIVKIALPITAILSILSLDFSTTINITKKRWGIIVGLLLLILFGIGLIYTQAPSKDAVEGFFKYNKILYLPFLIPLFSDYTWRRHAMNVLILVAFIDIPFTFMYNFGISRIATSIYPGGYPVYAISVSVILAFVAFVVLSRIFQAPKHAGKIFYATLFIIATYTLFFIYSERTGQFVFFFLLALFIIQKWHFKGLIAAILIPPFLATGLFLSSKIFKYKITALVNQPLIYLINPQKKDSSIGFRLACARYTLNIIKLRPIIGNGTGSFKSLYAASGGPQLYSDSLLFDPHNEYLMIAVQLGVSGVILFLLWLAMTIHDSFLLPPEEKFLMQGLVLTLFLTGFGNASLYTALIGLFYIIFLAVFYAAPLIEQRK